MPRKIGIQVYKDGGRQGLESLASLAAAVAQLRSLLGQATTGPTGPMPAGHVETQVTSDGLILTPFGTPSREVSDAIMAGWPRDLWTDAARVAYLEANHWSPTAERNTLDQAGGRCGVHIGYINGVSIVSEDSVGLFQVNVCSWPYTRDMMLDPRKNALAGYLIYRQQGWAAWYFTCVTLGLIKED